MKSRRQQSAKQQDVMTPRDHTWRHDRAGAFLFVPYSVKLARRVKLYGPELYDFWAEFEFDPNLCAFNELPYPLFRKGVAGNTLLLLSAIVRTRSGQLDGVVLTADLDATSALLAGYKVVAESVGIQLRPVLLPSLRTTPLLRNNQHRMLRFLALYRNMLSSSILDRLRESLDRTGKGISIAALQKLHSDIDPSICVAAIALLIAEGRAKTDIDTRPFDRRLAVTSVG